MWNCSSVSSNFSCNCKTAVKPLSVTILFFRQFLFFARARFHIASSFSLVALGTAITARKRLIELFKLRIAWYAQRWQGRFHGYIIPLLSAGDWAGGNRFRKSLNKARVQHLIYFLYVRLCLLSNSSEFIISGHWLIVPGSKRIN